MGRVNQFKISSLSFIEKWYFDDKSNQFSKKVNGVILFHDVDKYQKGNNNDYCIPLNDSTKNEYNPRYLIAENIIYDVPVTKTANNDCNDINWWYNYLEASKREKLFNTLTNKVMFDTIKPFWVYKPKFPYKELMPGNSNKGPLSFGKRTLSEIYYGRSQWYVSDPLAYGMTDEKILACCFELSDWTTVKSIRFHEQWYFDTDKYRFEKKVLGIGLIVNTFNEEGIVTGDTCLVYYKLEN